MTAVILGVDPGVHRLGLAVCDVVSGEPLWCGSLPITEDGGGHAYQQIGAALSDVMLSSWEPVIVAVEDPTHASRGKKQAAQWGGILALIEAEARRRWPHVEVWRISPPGWKKAIGLAGNADKFAYALWAVDRGWPVAGDFDAAAAAGVATWAHITNERGREVAA